jgi:chitin disaccharide deacetylase
MNPTLSQRRLIVNADDFGLSVGVNRGIIQAHENGIVTSASLMVRGPAAGEAAALAHEHPRLSVGLHLDLCEWRYVDEAWHPAYQVVPTDDAAAVRVELGRQLEAFRSLLGRDPTHLDSHQHVHRSEPVRSIALAQARALGVVLRDCDAQVRYCGEFYGQSNKGYPYPEGISLAGLVRIVRALPVGVTELGCHPGATPPDLDSQYGQERAVECQTLCDPHVRAVLAEEGIVLCSFTGARA